MNCELQEIFGSLASEMPKDENEEPGWIQFQVKIYRYHRPSLKQTKFPATSANK